MAIERERSAKGKELLSCRNVLWCLAFCGFAITSMLEFNLSLTIIAMVIPRPKAAVISQCTHDVHMTSNIPDPWVNGSSATDFKTSTSFLELATTYENTTSSPVRYSDRFAWNEYEQGLALGASFWLHWVTQIPGGLLARRYGTKFIFGWANLATAILGFLLPFCARYDLYAFIALRVLQGLFTGCSWPSMHNMVAKWIPPNERSKFITSYLGSAVGTAITYPLCGIFITWFGWDSVFYATSALGVMWYIAWYCLVYDTPQEHPRISEAEKTYILEALGDSVNHISSQPVPWKAILTSGPVWITAFAYCGGNWGIFTISIEAPSYFYNIHGWDISATSLLSAAPHVIRMLFSYVFSSFADWLLRTKRMSTTNLRKFAMFVCDGFQSILLLGLAFSGCYSNLAIVFMITGMAVGGAFTAGTLASCIDLSPNYASIILGICNVMSVSAGFIAPLIVGILTNNNQTIEQWRLVFLITIAIIFSTGALYMFLGTSELQPWNRTKDQETGEELQELWLNVGAEVENDKTTDIITISEPENESGIPSTAFRDHADSITDSDSIDEVINFPAN